ncbi:MAG: hypothetical protein QM697_00115 [Lachnospiraceae bacterium]
MLDTPTALTRLKRHKTIPFLDVHTTGTEVSWARIGKSTIFDLILNANIVTSAFIESEMPTDDVTYYKPTLSQELQANAGDPAFDFLYNMFYNLPTGEDIKKTALFVFAGTSSPYNAWQCEVSVILKDFNTVDEKILFDLNINSITRGTATVTAGVPAFTAAE